MTEKNKAQELEKMEVKKQIQKQNLISEFIEFIKNYGVIGLALGVIIGGAVNNLVKSLTDNLINPIIGYILPSQTLASFTFYNIKIGLFLTDTINFVILMFVVYFSIKFLINRFLSKDELEKLKVKK